MAEIHYHPLAPHIRADPYPTYAALRSEAPVYEVPGLGLHAISRYDDVVRVMRDPRLFSSSAMHDLMMRAGSAGQEDHDPDEEPNSLLGSDPPIHTRLRKIVNRGFTRPRIAELEPRIQAIADALIDRMLERGSCDLVADYAVSIPVKVIAGLLGIDEEREADFKRWSDALLMAASAEISQEQAAECGRCHDEWSDYLDEVIEERRRQPGDDLVSALLAHDDELGRLSEDEIATFTTLLLIAGNETTTHAIANAALALLEHPGQRALLRARPELRSALVEEALRFDTPVQLVLRRATKGCEIAGQAIGAGSTLALLIGSANRDERIFENADCFDLTREKCDHLAFGLGTHFCLGAPLARLETGIALGTLFDRVPDLELAAPSTAWLPRIDSLLVRGPLELPLVFEPCSAARKKIA